MTTQSKGKHTPGPWRVDIDSDGQFPVFEVYAGNEPLFDVYSPHGNDEQAEANARLIAAAPELLRQLIIEHQPSGCLSKHCSSCEAIAKSEGR